MIDNLITEVMKAEGWDKYTDHPADRGGPTKWGITLKAWSEWRGHDVSAIEVKNITEAQARDFYEKLYVIGPRFNQLPERIVPLVVDCGVNHGVRRASKWVQQAIGAKADGFIGPKSIQAALDCNPIATHLLISASRIKLYGRLVSSDPTLKAAKRAGFRTQAEFSAGWNNRAAKFLVTLAQSLK